MTTECIAIIGFITTVVAAFGGAALGAGFAYKTGMKLVQATHKNAIELMRRQEFNKSAAEFKIAFIPELRYLDYRYSPERKDTPGIYKSLSLAFDKHEIAIIKFRPHLCRQQQIGFDKAWDEYCNKKNDSKPHFMVYAEPEGPIDIIDKREIYLEKLNALLVFAEPKH